MKLSNKISTFLRKGHCNQKLLFFLCVVALALPNFFLFFTERLPLMVRITNIVLPLSAFWWIMTSSKRPGKAFLLMFLFMFFNAFQIVLLYLFGNSVIAVDMFLNLYTTNYNEAGELLSNIYPAVIFVAVIYLSLILWSIYSLYHEPLNNKFRHRNRKWAKYGCATGMILLIGCYVFNKNFELENDIYPINVIYNAGLAVEREMLINNYSETSHDFSFNPQTAHDPKQKELYVLVIGETARAKNFGIYGYERNTTPLLASTNNLCVFTDALSQSNTTHKSVPMIMSAVSADNFNDIYQQKSIITAFEEAHYSTAFFSTQQRNHSFIEFFGEEADVHIFLKDNRLEDTNIYDSELLTYVQNYLKGNNSTKRFIVLHTYGSHFDYSERYPADKAYYTPDKTTSATAENRNILVNAYDNTIRATDEFLYNIIKMVEAEKGVSAVMYVSDHGEDIYDDENNLFLHSSPNPSLFQLHIPFIVWTSPEFNSTYPDKYNNLTKHTHLPISCNLAVFHTMLDMAGISSFYKKDHHALSNEFYEPNEVRMYLNDHNLPVPTESILY